MATTTLIPDGLESMEQQLQPVTPTDPNLRFLVLNESSLGVIRNETPQYFEPLASSVNKGGPNPLNGPYLLARSSVLRSATLADFAEYRVSPKYHVCM